MIIALDYDGTYTLAPAFWDQFVKMASIAGHTVVIATARHRYPPHIINGLSIPIYYCGNELKEKYMLRQGIKIDIWIDDMPGMIQECKILNFD